MPQVYIVTSGDYSDYSIKGAFSTQEKAEAFRNYLNELNREGANVEEWELDVREPKPVRQYFYATIRTDTGALYYSGTSGKHADEPMPRTTGNSFNCTGYSTESPEHALKLAAEMRQAWLRETRGKYTFLYYDPLTSSITTL